MIRDSDVVVTLEGGMATVEVKRKGLIAELRDYDVEKTTETHPELWTDSDGRTCTRRYVTDPGTGPVVRRVGKELERFADDLEAHTGLATKLDLSTDDDGLHAIQIAGADFYFNANGTGYDGWGRAMNQRGKRSS